MDYKYIICGQLVSEAGFIHQKRCIEDHVLILVNEGTLHINVAGVSYDVSRGQYVLLPAGEWHYGTKESEGRLSYYWIHFCCKGTCPHCNTKRYKGTCPHCNSGKFVVNGRIAVLFHQLADIAFDEDEGARKMCDLAVKMILIELERENAEAGMHEKTELPNAVASAIAYINRNYITEIQVSELADKYGYTADYFSTLFKKSTGETVTGFVNKVRIRASKALLTSYGASIKEVAYSCGFLDEKYFMRVFKRYEGITPTEYRKNAEKAYINKA